MTSKADVAAGRFLDALAGRFAPRPTYASGRVTAVTEDSDGNPVRATVALGGGVTTDVTTGGRRVAVGQVARLQVESAGVFRLDDIHEDL